MGFLFGHKKSYEKALDWFKNNMVTDKGIIVHTRLQEPYPEVTGYFIPTLYAWGEIALARECTKWLISIQSEDGSFPAPDGTPYTFDTGQIMRGFCAALGDVDGVEEPLTRACDWILTQIDSQGRLHTPSTELWGDIADDMIHTYVLPPLREAGSRLNNDEYIKAADFVLTYYKGQDELVPFNRLSHFHAYIMEALCELGEIELASRGMAEVERLQNKDGSIPAYPDVKWVCSTGMAQYAVIWYMLDKKEPADRAIRFLDKIQNKSGGFFGSYGEGSDYIPNAEISWAVKYFLDAYRLKIQRGKPGA
jgi:malonyl-CoA O-methyltransferase